MTGLKNHECLKGFLKGEIDVIFLVFADMANNSLYFQVSEPIVAARAKPVQV